MMAESSDTCGLYLGLMSRHPFSVALASNRIVSIDGISRKEMKRESVAEMKPTVLWMTLQLTD